MKVVLFCGGRGIRLRELSEAIPKPMVTIGYRPILWHVMRYYAHFGHRDFILCLGYRADAIKEYFLRYEEALSNDFVLSDGGRQIELLGSDIQDWRITFADTGLDSTIGERLRLVRRHLEGEELFLANYGDTLTDAPLDRIVEDFRRTDAVASFLSVRASVYPFRLLETDGAARVRALVSPAVADLWINGGYFVLRPSVFDVVNPGEELVEEPFARLAQAGLLRTARHDGFWAPMDTLRDFEELEQLARSGRPPWQPATESGLAPA
jgi:glucose-1-phosphate cytidylyltransferase